MKTVFSLTFLMLISLNIFAEKTSTVFSGYIFIDENENGIKDKKEKGLINIPVSNGDTIIKTDKNGFFSISCDNATSLFPVLPSDYELSGGNIKNSLFHFNNDTLNREIFFPVRKTGKTQNHKIAVIGDPQVDNLKQLDYAIRSVYQELTNRDDLDINIFLGDIINEKNDLLPLSRTVIENIGTSSYVACGNHDLDYSIPLNKDSVFNSVFGASTYSFNKGNVHYIVIQNVYSEPSKRNYKGFYTDRQLRFIKNDLLSVPANTQIVIVQHIPVAATENFGELAAILQGRKEILVLSAHTHTLRRNIFNFNNVLVHEINAGTACGTFWLGEQSWNQIPVAIMNCGTPPCYFTIDFNEKDYKIDFKAIGFDADMQMDIWINNKIKSEKEKKGRMPEKEVSEIAETEIFPQGAIVANIFGACDSTTVQISIDNGPFLPMTHTPAISPRVSYLRQAYSDNILPSAHSTKIPLMKTNSPHIWIFSPETELPEGIHSLTIKAADRFGFEVVQTQSFIK